MSPKLQALDPNLYKQLLEKETRYQEFGAELTRISFAGIALLGFFVQYVRGKCIVSSETATLNWLSCAVVAFALCVACALAHRFYTTQGFSHRVHQTQFRIAKSASPAAFAHQDELDDAEARARRNFSRSSRTFRAASRAIASLRAASTLA